MKYLFIIVFVLVTLFGVGFFMSQKDANQTVNKTVNVSTGEKYKIVAFGDSLTAGYGVSLEESYPAILEKYLKADNPDIEIINSGVSGETTTGGLDRVDFIISQNPQLVLLGLGANDMFRSTDPEIVKANLENMILKFKEKNISVILLGMKAQAGNGAAYRGKFNTIYTDLAKKHTIPLVPFFLENVVLVKDLNITDGIHPNKDGYEKIVEENVLPVVRRFLR